MIEFKLLFYISIALWSLGLLLFFIPAKTKIINNIGLLILILSVLLHIGYVAELWHNLQRPPIRTLGETRLWYSLFLPLLGLVIYFRWKLKWMIAYSYILAAVFLLINFLHPENFDKTLMPALQSYWFVPHVIVYIFAYAILASSALIAIRGLYLYYHNKYEDQILTIADNTVYLGFSFITFGLLFGALWAKEAWGHYWTWDPKETWAFLTWIGYLIYIHFRIHNRKNTKLALWVLSLAFVVLLTCWFGLNYLPTAQQSVHTYTNQ